MFVAINAKFVKKMSSQNKKLKKLTANCKSKNNTPQKAINIVENHSSQSFDNEELSLLNKGLKFALPSSEGVLEESYCKY